MIRHTPQTNPQNAFNLEAKPTLTIALLGNPNSGKTTIFNNLTGAHQRVGNYGGVTVEIKQGHIKHNSFDIKAIDLPGTYSLTAWSIEERLSRQYLINEKPDVILDIIDSCNLDRSLYLTTQLKELGVPLVIALNMADELKKKGLQIDLKSLSQALGAPVVTTVGTRNKGSKELLQKALDVATGLWSPTESQPIHYGSEIETELKKIENQLINPNHHLPDSLQTLSPQWLAIKLLENDHEIQQNLHRHEKNSQVLEQTALSRKYLEGIFGEDPEILIAEQRYGYIHGITRTICQKTLEARINLSDKIDKVLTNRVLGLPIFALMMYLTFWFVFTLGAYPMAWIETAQHALSTFIETTWAPGADLLLKSLVTDGVIAGVGGVIAFLPNILLLYFALSLLEDTGYMARAAFIMDRLMKWVGLHGKSFIPMLAGFGCSVPAIMGTRILDNRRDRLTTILVLPLMSCGARLTIYMLLIPVFFDTTRSRSIVMYSMYIIGIVLAIIGAKLLRSTVFKGDPSPFVMELPPYRIPTFKAITIHMWQRAWIYLRKAGTVILGFSILMWFLASFPRLPQDQTPIKNKAAQLEYSIAGRIGRGIEPALKPLGFDWKIGTALVGAFAAKELFVSQMGIVYSLGEIDLETNQPNQKKLSILRTQLRNQYTPLVGFCVMLFCLISTPCMATVAVTRRETNSWKWALIQFGGLTLLAYTLTMAVYQVGTLLNIGIH